MASFQHDDQVLIQETLFVRILTLNRPRQLNALSLEMLSQLSQLFLAYEDDANAKLIILKGKGRAFCAGGDVATVHRRFLEGNLKFGEKIGEKLLTLTYLVATCSKPQASLKLISIMSSKSRFNIFFGILLLLFVSSQLVN